MGCAASSQPQNESGGSKYGPSSEDFEVLVNEMRASWSTSPEWAKSDSLSFINTWSHKRLQLRPASGQIRAAFPQLKDDTCSAVAVPDAFREVFHKAERTVAEYFALTDRNPTQGSIAVRDQRYIMMRGPSLAVEFPALVERVYGRDRQEEAHRLVHHLLYDLARGTGASDSDHFSETMGLKGDPITRLSAGPVHFAFTGWAVVKIAPESTPAPNESFYLLFDHPYGFEAFSCVDAKRESKVPVCAMGSGYSAGWCTQAFGLPLVTQEVLCVARGDRCCRFIMAPPMKVAALVRKYKEEHPELNVYEWPELPGFLDHSAHEEHDHAQMAEELSALAREKQWAMHLLHSILPKPVASRMLGGETNIVDSFDHVGVCFLDMVKFSVASSKMLPEKVVLWLTKVFALLDDVRTFYKIEKIKTIGDCYMVAAGIPERLPPQTATQRIVMFALDSLALLAAVPWASADFPNVDARVGVHIGPAVAGVIGDDKFAYDLWSSTVNIASRMESTGRPNRVQISVETRNFLQQCDLKDNFVFEPVQHEHIKGMDGPQVTYLVSYSLTTPRVNCSAEIVNRWTSGSLLGSPLSPRAALKSA